MSVKAKTAPLAIKVFPAGVAPTDDLSMWEERVEHKHLVLRQGRLIDTTHINEVLRRGRAREGTDTEAVNVL